MPLESARRKRAERTSFVPLPDLTYRGLRALRASHRQPRLLLRIPVCSSEHMHQATTHMDRGGVQRAVKALVAACGEKKGVTIALPNTAFPLVSLAWSR